MIVDLVLGLAAALYILAALFLTLFIVSFAALLIVYALKRNSPPSLPDVSEDDLLSVTVQLPVYNEESVIEWLVDVCAQLDYPTGKLSVQFLDDSTDKTTQLIEQRLAYWQEQGVSHLTLLRRPERRGYKAGALAYGLEQTHTDCIVVFDADFLPPPDFLRRTMPYFNGDPQVGLVQTRWGHLNTEYNWLTRAQALSLDGHFAIEQVARSRGCLPMSMNGTGGIWRTAALRSAGGWSSATITEDLDLSYRALLDGWRFVYLVDVVVEGELPPQVQAYKVQQAHWATGFTECLIRHGRALIRSRRLSPAKRWMGLMHLCSYAVQPLILLVFLLTPVLMLGDVFPQLGFLRFTSVTGIIVPLFIVLGQLELYRDWPRRLLYMPVQFLVGAAIVLNNTRGVLAGLHSPSVQREFRRTPKFHLISRNQTWIGSPYLLPLDITTLGEIGLGVYALAGVVIARDRLPVFVPYMAIYAFAFVAFAWWNLYQAWRSR
ncbi:MAG TPA: glycosyltransferase [Aggregatilineaceae bacterium]|nr:glycosyltransferase [Aggregatilineaceae bacterium]